MEKASRALRRSGVKLLSMTGGYTDLNVLLSDVSEMRSTAKAFMTAQSTAAQDLMRWAANEDNRAVQDVVAQIYELQHVWMEIQKVFTDRIKDFRLMFEMILDGQKNLAQAKTNWEYCDQKEAKMRKELKKAVKRVSSIEINILESRVSQAQQEKELAHIELIKEMKENEAVKLIRLKEGFVKMSNAYIEMSHKCNTLFTAQREVSLCLPDVHNIELERSKYTGASTTRQLVIQAKEKVANFNEANCANMTSEPPPPYTPPDPAHSATRDAPARPANPSLPQRSATPTSSRHGSTDSGHLTSERRHSQTSSDGSEGCATGEIKFTNIVRIQQEGKSVPEFQQTESVSMKGGEQTGKIMHDGCSGEKLQYNKEEGHDKGFESRDVSSQDEYCNNSPRFITPAAVDDDEDGSCGREYSVTTADSNQLYPCLDRLDLNTRQERQIEPHPVPVPRHRVRDCQEVYHTAEEDD